MNTHRTITAALVLLLAPACSGIAAQASGEGPDDPGIPGGGILLVGTGRGLTGLDAATGEVLFDAPDAVASPDRSIVYATDAGGSLRAIDARTGKVRASAPAPTGTIPIAAAEGGLVALIPEGVATYPDVPTGRTATPIDVVDTTGDDPPLHLDLEGNFEPEAFSTDGEFLFLIQYLPAEAPTRYRVMQLGLASGRVLPIASPDRVPSAKVPPAAMQGVRLQQVWAPDRTVLYTLYTNQVAGREPLTFVHALNLKERWAHCIDLPAPFGASPPGAKAMAGSAEGKHLVITDATTGKIATINTRRFSVETTVAANLPSPGSAGSASASIAPNGVLYASGGSQVAAFDAGTSAPGPMWVADQQLYDVHLASDGKMLYLATGDAIEARNPSTGTLIGSVHLAGGRDVLAVFDR